MKKTNETLLAKATAHVPRGNVAIHHRDAEEMAELAVAWVTDKVRTSQVGAALGVGNSRQGSVYNALATGLRHAVRLGLLIEKNGHK